jgi:Cft2 family RNA processing exonuclease
MAWDVQFKNGIWLPQAGWWLDAHHAVDRSFISHAHFDHLGRHREILCTEVTSRFMQARMPSKKRREHILPFGHTEQLTEDITVTLHPAGHILGSSQILLEHPSHGRLLYSGDFKVRQGLVAETCATPHADVLIMETTFGRPHYLMPPTDDVRRDIVQFCKDTLASDGTPVLFAYSLGKCQEVLASLGNTGLPVMLHPQAEKLTRIHEECGIVFPTHREFNAEEAAGHVVITPPQWGGSSLLKAIPSPRTAMITGWALDRNTIHRHRCDAAFALSDHADFADLLSYVERVNPQKVLTLHGFAEDFARILRERGIEAWALGRGNQLDLGLGGPVS